MCVQKKQKTRTLKSTANISRAPMPHRHLTLKSKQTVLKIHDNATAVAKVKSPPKRQIFLRTSPKNTQKDFQVRVVLVDAYYICECGRLNYRSSNFSNCFFRQACRTSGPPVQTTPCRNKPKQRILPLFCHKGIMKRLLDTIVL